MVSFLSQYEILYHKAIADFSAAGILYKSFNEGNSELDLEVICFHLQQCAEKLLKAVLSRRKINFPKIHDLETLLDILVLHRIDFECDRNLLIELSDYAVEGRYAVLHDDLENILNIFVLLKSMIVKAQKIVYETSQEGSQSHTEV